MKHLADLIRKGLSAQNVVEDPSALYIEDYRGSTHADIIGLALIGKLGLFKACQLTCRSRCEIGEAETRINQELQLAPGDRARLISSHWNMSARDVAESL